MAGCRKSAAVHYLDGKKRDSSAWNDPTSVTGPIRALTGDVNDNPDASIVQLSHISNDIVHQLNAQGRVPALRANEPLVLSLKRCRRRGNIPLAQQYVFHRHLFSALIFTTLNNNFSCCYGGQPSNGEEIVL